MAPQTSTRSKPARPSPKSQAKGVALARATFERLAKLHSDAHCELEHENPFELIVATVLSAQTTDVLVNKVTPDLFARYPDAPSLARAELPDVERALSRIGMFRQKAKNIVGLARMLVEKHGGQVPRTLNELVELPGVGRKTANVVLGVAFNAPEGVVVDTHVQRLSQRLGWTRHTEPPEIERDLMATFPREQWDLLGHVLIFHGRRVCFARKPACASCVVNDVCPCAFRAENVGRKAPRSRIAKGARALAPKVNRLAEPAAAKPKTSRSAAKKRASSAKVAPSRKSAAKTASPAKAASKAHKRVPR